MRQKKIFASPSKCDLRNRAGSLTNMGEEADLRDSRPDVGGPERGGEGEGGGAMETGMHPAEQGRAGRLARSGTMTSEEGDTAGLLKKPRPGTVAEAWKELVSPSRKGRQPATRCSGALAEARSSLWHMALGTKMNVLLVCAPLGVASDRLGWGSGVSAVLSLLALCPLAERLGFTTEQLALRTNDTLGALLNVTFGNATELILSIVALREGEIELIQMSLVGSILSNQFLVLGSAMVVGGVKHGVQLFERQSAVLHLALLVGSSVALIVPAAILYAGGSTEEAAVTWLSRFISVLMIATYALFLYYILRLQHKQQVAPKGSAKAPEKFSILHTSGHHTALARSSLTLGGARGPQPHALGDVEMGSVASAAGGGDAPFETKPSEVWPVAAAAEEDEDEEEPVLSTWAGVFWLAVVAVLISFMSDILVDNIERGAAEDLGVPSGFLYTIIVPIVGNAAEHTSALIFSHRNKPDIAFGIAVGSSVQIALMVIPACVLIAWPMGKDLTLSFGSFLTCVYAASVVLLFTTISDGNSNWMKGALLITSYMAISVGVWFV